MDLPIDSRILDDRFAAGDGDIIAHSYPAQPDVQLVADSDMDNMFDFEGYHDEQQPFTGYWEQESPNVYQQHGNFQQEEPTSTVHSQGMIDCDSDSDDDGWQSLFESALANYYFEDPLKCDLVSPVSSTFAEDLTDPPGTVDVTEITILSSIEKWDVDRATVEYLESVSALLAPIGSISARYGLRPSLRDIRLEEPVLQSDPVTDMLRLRERNVVRLETRHMAPFPPDRRHDQDLRWSNKSLKLPSDLDKQLAAEKMIVNSETGHFLRQIFEDTNGDFETSLSKNCRLEAPIRPITPPLLPLSPPHSPGRILSSAAQLQYTSTPEDPLVREGAGLETHIMIDEDITMTEASDSEWTDIYSPSKSLANAACSSPFRRKLSKISDLKMSSPLLPLEQDGPLAKKSKIVAFAEEIEALTPRRDSNDVSTDPFVAANKAFAAVSAMIEPLAQSAMDKADSEQLVEIDTIARLDVPHIEEVKSIAPWELYLGRHQALLRDAKRDISNPEKKWSGASSLERLLPWSPFPAHLGKPEPEGDFDDGSFARYLAELHIEAKVDLQAMISKPDGLHLLDLGDEDELDACDYSLPDEDARQNRLPQGTQVVNTRLQDPTRSLHALPARQTQGTERSRPAAKVDSVAAGQSAPQTENSPHALHARPRGVEFEVSTMQALLENRKNQLQREKATLDARLLSNIDDLRGNGGRAPGRKEVAASVSHGTLDSFMAVQGVSAMHQKEVQSTKRAEASVESRHLVLTSAPSQLRLEIPAPQISILKSTLPIVVSSAIMANRQLIRKLQQQLPALSMIERESTSTNNKQVGTSSPVREADFTLSPSTGLMFTTLQKLKQKPLPGQEASFISVREQIARVAPRYERLIVLLSEGSRSSSEAQLSIRTLDERDSTTITDLIEFFSRLDTEVQVFYVPGGDDELVKWIAATVSRFAPCIEGFSLLDEETVWERFLRKAGLNAFAAQVVLDQLKPLSSRSDTGDFVTSTSTPTITGHDSYGLAAFVSMDVEGRVQRFGPSIGGKRILSRVSLAIDGSWKLLAKERA